MRTRICTSAAAALAAALLPARSAADQAIVSLPQLIAQSTHIVIGTCRQGEPEAARGVVRFRIDVEELLQGTLPGPIVLQTSADDPEGPKCGPGVRKLLFLRQRGTDAGGQSAQGLAFEPVEHGAGVIEIAHDGAIEATIGIVRRALDPRSAVRLTAFRDFLLRSATPPPRPLVAALLEGRSGSVASADRALVAAMACDTAGSYLRAAELWAISEAGVLRVGAARACLEARATVGADRTEWLTAIGALGDLGDRHSVAALLPFIDVASSAGTSPRATQRDRDLTSAVALALGKIRASEAVSSLGRVARESPDLALHSTVVHALGLIGGTAAHQELRQIAASHPHPLVRDQAGRTAASIDSQPPRRIP